MLTQLSDQIADVVNTAAASVVQVQGHRSPASGVIYQADLVLTTVRAVGREEHPRVQRSDGQTFDAEIAGWEQQRKEREAACRIGALGVRVVSAS